jgi:hypothetical protein
MARLTYKREIRCNFVDCAAGGGVAGKHGCFFGGSWWEEDCPDFVDERVYLAQFGADGDEAKAE